MTAQTPDPGANEASEVNFSLPASEVELLVSYIRIPSETGQERAAGEYFRSICKKTGLYIEPFGERDGNFNFAASLYPLDSKKPNIILLNHIDVVPPGDLSEWEYPPFDAQIVDGEIWGRGAFDNKGVAIMQLSALSRFVVPATEKDFPFNVTLLAVCCEETQCAGGARFVTENYLDKLNPFVVIGEGPPAFQGIVTNAPEEFVFGIANAHKRAVWLKLEIEIQTSGHASVPPHDYANKSLITAVNVLLSKKSKAVFTAENRQFLKQLGKLQKGMKGFILRNPSVFKCLIIPQLRKQPEVFSLFSNTIVLTNFSNPNTAHNAIPEKASCLLDCRLLPEVDEKDFLAAVMKKLSNEKINVEIIMQTPKTEPTPITHPAYDHLREAVSEHFGSTSKIVYVTLPYLNDSGWFRAKGVPAFDVIPIQISRQHIECVHGHNERLPITSLKEGANVYALFLEKMMQTIVQTD